MTLQSKCSDFFLEEEGQPTKKLKETKQSIFQLAFQKQGSKQLYRTLRKGAKSRTKSEKDGWR